MLPPPDPYPSPAQHTLRDGREENNCCWDHDSRSSLKKAQYFHDVPAVISHKSLNRIKVMLDFAVSDVQR